MAQRDKRSAIKREFVYTCDIGVSWGDMTKRQRRKPGETRGQLMAAVLSLVGRGRHFASLGIREVTREAGVVPTSFYRHFRNMDELGLQLVDELGLVLRRMMRDARNQASRANRMIDASVSVFIASVQANRAFFIFMAQSLTGDSRAVRDAVRSEMRFFVHELMNDLRRLGLLENLDDGDLEMACDLVIRVVAFSLTDLLAVGPDEDVQIERIRRLTVRHLRLVFLGAGHWHSQVAETPTP